MISVLALLVGLQTALAARARPAERIWSDPEKVAAAILRDRPYLDPEVTRAVTGLLASYRAGGRVSDAEARGRMLALGPAAVAPLSGFKGDSAAVHLAVFLGRDAVTELVRMRWAEPLIEMGAPLIPDIVRAWEQNVGFSSAPMAALGAFGKAATPALVQLLDHREKELRAGAAQILAHSLDPDVGDVIVEGLSSPAKEVRYHLGLAARDRADKRAASAFLAMTHDSWPALREVGSAGLGAVYDRQYRGRLVALAKWDRNAHVRFTAANALLGTGLAVESRLAARYRPSTFDPAAAGAAFSAAIISFGIVAGLFLVASAWLARAARQGAGILGGRGLAWLVLCSLSFYSGFGIRRTTGGEEWLLLLVVLPVSLSLGLAVGSGATTNRAAVIRVLAVAIACFALGQTLLWGWSLEWLMSWIPPIEARGGEGISTIGLLY